MEIRKVLWPTDFSSSAEAAMSYVQSLSRSYGAEVHVLHVLEDIMHHEGWYGEFDENHLRKLMEKAEKRVEQRLDQICERHLEGCPMYIRHVAVGDPAKEILKLIDAENVDLVVMATRGKNESFVFGSVAEKVTRHSPVPVTTIPVEGS
ncbi:MAG: universal stress protein [Desulfobacterales bacterium]|nr:universal stress protein [Desulfobacterales bacterium]